MRTAVLSTPADRADQPGAERLSDRTTFHLRFESLFNPGRGLVFPCDASGCVEIDELSEPARQNYFYARTVIGREFATPAVVHGDATVTA